MEHLEHEVLQLIVAYRHYQATKQGLYYLELQIEKVKDILASNPVINTELKRLLSN